MQFQLLVATSLRPCGPVSWAQGRAGTTLHLSPTSLFALGCGCRVRPQPLSLGPMMPMMGTGARCIIQHYRGAPQFANCSCFAFLLVQCLGEIISPAAGTAQVMWVLLDSRQPAHQIHPAVPGPPVSSCSKRVVCSLVSCCSSSGSAVTRCLMGRS